MRDSVPKSDVHEMTLRENADKSLASNGEQNLRSSDMQPEQLGTWNLA